ncbi:hypothetical protein E4U13_003380 [Claviceps humidiphila]|uniref:JmjC domain-containing protein n=2 Tax=Claviceps TaxID=5110 RepID=A0A9P7MP01_9HYPO|nr:hypothetical protein E4U57_004593 [Claviceps arundinis]KAG5990112.1 hypothetical protein E4U52_004947 [Claviceps spartinae]KAG6075506.1 hypothetical protein E4U15_005599 [Claviceps sp. LM218 group G6]KAG6095617.1 hypothetical protein E4U30_002205 [Claviceps sp. LM220 group G6]KAG6097803.1 hypothetical protein E4U14_007652 [Claviceps sp. LM454 group G7]KAG6103803.1 hypothetical protein E4U31_002510 [Claviceps sp. LM219 group G6]KAG6114409.1 hypothetical protein E4U13_003380 [Claviceps humid
MSPPANESALRHLITTYYELNGSVIEELDSEPSPLEFMRYVSRNTPFVIRGGASSWKATRQWNAAYLKKALAAQCVNVAVTPHGNADAPTFSPEHAVTVMSKPHEESQPFDEFLAYLIQQEKSADSPQATEVRYAQTQNDNFRDEYACLLPDAQQDIAFARIALQKSLEAVNLWIGNSRSVTATHKDNFENIFVQIVGRKHFVLLPPICHPCMNEVLLKPATYKRDNQGLSIQLDEGADLVPSAIWDPDDPQVNPTPLSKFAKPMRITLNPGDMLYLPAMWYHKVSQSSGPGEEGFVAAINYWYDMDFSGPLYPAFSLIRTLTQSIT